MVTSPADHSHLPEFAVSPAPLRAAIIVQLPAIAGHYPMHYKAICITIAFLFAALSLPAQTGGESVYRSYLRARGIVDAGLAAHRMNGNVLRTISMEVGGSRFLMGHFSKPGKTMEFRIAGRALFDVAGNRLRWFDTLSVGTQVYPGGIIIAPGRIWYLDNGDPEPETLLPSDIPKHLGPYCDLMPPMLLRLAMNNAASLESLGADTIGGLPQDVVSFADMAGKRRVLFFDHATGLLTRSAQLAYDALRGDHIAAFDYGAYRNYDGIPVPSRVVSMIGGDTDRVMDYRGIEVNAPVPPGSFARQAKEAADVPGDSAMAASAPSVVDVPVAPGVYALEIRHLNNRTFVAECKEYVIAMEAPRNSAAGELIIAKIKEMMPGKPIRYLFISHHHPDYIGGIRPFIEEGATIVTTPGNAAYVNLLAGRPHTIESDRHSGSKREPVIHLVRGKDSFGDSSNAVQVFDIGPKTFHTDEYLIYYFPRQKLLLQGDLLSFPEDGSPGRVWKGTRGLYESILERGLDVKTILHSWPLRGAAAGGTFEQLERMLQAADAEPKK